MVSTIEPLERRDLDRGLAVGGHHDRVRRTGGDDDRVCALAQERSARGLRVHTGSQVLQILVGDLDDVGTRHGSSDSFDVRTDDQG